MSVALVNSGVKVIRYSSCSKDETRLFDMCGIENKIVHIKEEARHLDHLIMVFQEYKSGAVIHMSAQPVVRVSYDNPVETYDANVMGTFNVLESVRLNSCVYFFEYYH